MCSLRNGWGWEGGKWRQSGDLHSMEIIGTAPWGGDKREGEPVTFKEEATVSLHLARKISRSCSLCPRLRGMGSPCLWTCCLHYICGDKP